MVWLGLAQAPASIIDDSSLAVEASSLSEAELPEILQRILTGVYQAFSGDGEEAIYDGMAIYVSGELLSDLYLQQRRAAAYGVMGGVATEIVDVELFKSDARREGTGYLIDAGWRVFGRVEHESHGHERMNIYEAELAIAPVLGQWRLSAFNLDNVRRENLDEFVGGE